MATHGADPGLPGRRRPGGRALPSGTAFLVKNGDRFFIFNEKGELVIGELTPKRYGEIGRCELLPPTNTANGREVLWSHPAFAQNASSPAMTRRSCARRWRRSDLI